MCIRDRYTADGRPTQRWSEDPHRPTTQWWPDDQYTADGRPTQRWSEDPHRPATQWWPDDQYTADDRNMADSKRYRNMADSKRTAKCKCKRPKIWDQCRCMEFSCIPNFDSYSGNPAEHIMNLTDAIVKSGILHSADDKYQPTKQRPDGQYTDGGWLMKQWTNDQYGPTTVPWWQTRQLTDDQYPPTAPGPDGPYTDNSCQTRQWTKDQYRPTTVPGPGGQYTNEGLPTKQRTEDLYRPTTDRLPGSQYMDEGWSTERWNDEQYGPTTASWFDGQDRSTIAPGPGGQYTDKFPTTKQRTDEQYGPTTSSWPDGHYTADQLPTNQWTEDQYEPTTPWVDDYYRCGSCSCSLHGEFDFTCECIPGAGEPKSCQTNKWSCSAETFTPADCGMELLVMLYFVGLFYSYVISYRK